MFEKQYLDEAEKTLSSYGDKTTTDPYFKNYKNGINNVLNDFINQINEFPLNEQLDEIAAKMQGEQTDTIKKLEKETKGKRTWTLIFSLAAAALIRKAHLPENHPEIEHINNLLSALSDGWINGFTGMLYKPKEDKIDAFLKGLQGWLKHYDINANTDDNSHKVLLALYTAACYLEKRFFTYQNLTPKKYLNVFPSIKEQIEFLEKELRNQQNEAITPQISIALLELNQGSSSLLFNQFTKKLTTIKMEQEKIQKEIDTFPHDHYKRLLDLQNLLKKMDSIEAFWKHYDTQEKLNQLMEDLEIPENEKAGWQEYFNYQHGSLAGQTLSLIWTGRWGVPELLGGIPSGTLSLETLTQKCNTVLTPLQATQTEITKYESQRDSGEKAPSKLIEEIEKELNDKDLVMLKKVDINILGTHLVNLMQEKKTEETGLAQTYKDIAQFEILLNQQEKMVAALEIIQGKIVALGKQGIDNAHLNDSFDLILNHINQIIARNDSFPSSLTSAEDKINYLKKIIETVKPQVEGIKISINSLVKQINEQNIKKQDDVVEMTRTFINTYEKKLAHKLLCFFSDSYKKMFASLKAAVGSEEKEKCFAKITKTLAGSEKYAKRKIISLFNETTVLTKIKEQAEEPIKDDSLSIPDKPVS